MHFASKHDLRMEIRKLYDTAAHEKSSAMKCYSQLQSIWIGHRIDRYTFAQNLAKSYVDKVCSINYRLPVVIRVDASCLRIVLREECVMMTV